MSFLSAPARGLFWVFEEIAKRVDQELYNEDAVKAELTDLYMKLEAGSITEEEFGRQEAELVSRLEAIEAHNQHRQRKARRGAR
jgi:gas vesicle protein GvpG